MRRAILTLIFLTTATGSFAAEMTEADLALLRDSWSNRKQTINEVSKYIESLKNEDLDSLAVMQLKKRIRELRAQANDTIRLTEVWWSKNPNWSKHPNIETRRRINYRLVEIRSECESYLNVLKRIEFVLQRFE